MAVSAASAIATRPAGAPARGGPPPFQRFLDAHRDAVWRLLISIVGPAEADPLQGRISNESPLGRALLGHKAGDEVEWSAPSGVSRVKILTVN